jgi:hypothetical protein
LEAFDLLPFFRHFIGVLLQAVGFVFLDLHLNIMKAPLFLIALLLYWMSSSSQGLKGATKIDWSGEYPLTIDDFTIRQRDSTHSMYNWYFIIEFHAPAFGQRRAFKYLHNYMIKEQSWIDTTLKPWGQIRIIQGFFDLNEIYTRKLRREMDGVLFPVNALKKYLLVYTLQSQNRQTEFFRDIFYNSQPGDETKLVKWEETIEKELDELKDWAVELKKR